MNFKQLQYAIELAKTRSFSQTSEKLNISQPALSKQILHLEKELGVKLFDRNTVPFTLTPAGEHFICQAQSLIYQEDQLIRSLDQFQSGEKGRITIGVSPFRNLYFMPKIIRQFKETYPGIQVVLHETNSDQLRRDAMEGKYDFAIVNLPVDDSVLDVQVLEPERLVLAVPNSMLSQVTYHGTPTDPVIDFPSCKNLPFVALAQPQEMRRYFDALCASYDFKPEIAVEVSGGMTTAWSMARAGIGATLLPLQFVDDLHSDDNLTLFPLNHSAYTRQPAIVTRRGQYISEPAKHFIALLTHG